MAILLISSISACDARTVWTVAKSNLAQDATSRTFGYAVHWKWKASWILGPWILGRWILGRWILGALGQLPNWIRQGNQTRHLQNLW